MEPLNAAEIRGNWATLLLPVNNEDGIDYKELENEIDTLAAGLAAQGKHVVRLKGYDQAASATAPATAAPFTRAAAPKSPADRSAAGS